MESIAPSSDSGLWRNADFLKLWAGQTISQVGSQVSFLAFPIVAVIALDATPMQMAILTAAGAIPALLVGLQAGALVDRHRRKPILICSDLGRAALLGIIPLAWSFGALSILLLYAVALVSGLLSLCFDLAYQAFIPAVVPRQRLVEGNAKLELSRTAAEFAGPGLAGGLIQVLAAPVTLLLDALSYVVSGLMIAWIRIVEPTPVRRHESHRIATDIRDGLKLVAHDPRLRSLAGGGVLIGFFNAALEVVFVLYIVRELGVGPAVLGLVFTVGSGGFLLGALLPERVARSIGFGPTTVAGVMLVAIGDLLVPFAGGSRGVVIAMLCGAQFLFGVGMTIFKVNQASLRQSIVPTHMQGRAGGTFRVIDGAVILLGAFAGGILGDRIGLRETLIVTACGEVLAGLWLWRSPLGRLRDIPAGLPAD